jgi:hypothetical protein
MSPSSRVEVSESISILEDEDTTLPRNVVIRIAVDAISCPRRTESSAALLRRPQNSHRMKDRDSDCKNKLLHPVLGQVSRVLYLPLRSVSVLSSRVHLDVLISVFPEDFQTQSVGISYLSHMCHMCLQFYSR